ncbi:MAG TPA: HAD-IA family hydrolase [Ignavibacteria bacterium]|nr:HAD-IA family hydrolase [Ignavibacteria bacterium]
MIKAVIFDLDNTLVDFMFLKSSAVNAAIHAMIDAGLNHSSEFIQKKVDEIYKDRGIEYQEVFDKLLIDLTGKIDYKILSAGIVAYRTAREAALKPYPKVLPTLLTLIKNGLKLAVVSDAPGKEAWLRLSYLNFHHLFDVVVTFSDSNERKPSPVPFNLALERLNLKAEECLMIGDWAERDVVGAKSVGMKTVFARYGDTFNTLNPGSDFDIKDISELTEIINNLNNKI